MTPEQERYWRNVLARARSAQPGMDREILTFLEHVRGLLKPSVVEDFVRNRDVDRMVQLLLADDVLDRLAAPLSEQVFLQTQDSIRYFRQQIPKEGALRIAFDTQNPAHLQALRQLDTKVMQVMKDDVRETVRAFTEAGIRDAVPLPKVARQIREVVGLGPTQLVEVENFRQALIDRDIDKVLSYKRRDARFDRRILKGEYSAADIENWTERYRARRIAWNAEAVSRTATLDALKQGERLTWEGAVSQKLVNRDRLLKQWLGKMDTRERPEHRAMEKQTVHFDARFSNGEMVPGESTYSCRCLARYFEERAARKSTRPRTVTPPVAPPAPEPTVPPAAAATAALFPESPATRLAAGLREAEQTIVRQPIEHAVGFALDGIEVLRKSGRRNAVAFTDAEVAALRNAVLTHNHPSGGWGLSDADVRFAMGGNLAEIRAVTPERVSRLVRPEAGRQWSADYFDGVVQMAYRRHRRALQIEWSDDVRAGTRSEAEFHQQFFHELWVRIARELGLDYRSEIREPDA